MSLSMFLLALWLILNSLGALGIVNVGNVALGVLGLVTGLLLLFEAAHPITLFRRRP